MEKYIKAHDNDKHTIMAEYEDLRGESDAAKDVLADSFTNQEIKNWFLGKFPEIREFHEMRCKMLTAAAN